MFSVPKEFERQRVQELWKIIFRNMTRLPFKGSKEKGAVMIGKNKSTLFFGGSGENSGFGPTSNPLCTK